VMHEAQSRMIAAQPGGHLRAGCQQVHVADAREVAITLRIEVRRTAV
jgi:hypothetical protein